MKFLDNLLKKDTPVETSLTELLHKNLAGVDKPRPLTRIHASDVTKPGYCPREIALMILENVPKSGNKIDPALQYTFDEGNDKQARLNNVWLREQMYGRWQCPVCGHTTSFGRHPYRCVTDECGQDKLPHKYVEVRVQHPATGMLGSMDAIVDIGREKLTLTECKIIKGADFETLKAPLAEHRVRTQLYLRLIRDAEATWLSEMVDTDEARILYMMRGHGKKNANGVISPFKEYTLKANDTTIRKYLAMASALNVFLDQWGKVYDGSNPMNDYIPAGICTDNMCSRASKCKVSKACFSGKYPQSVTWVDKPECFPVHHGHPDVKLIATDQGVHAKAEAG